MKRRLTFEELARVEDQWYSKATAILDEGRGHLTRYEYDLAVRRAQEALELYVKGLFRFLQADYVQNHEQRKQTYELAGLLEPLGIGIGLREIAQLVMASATLHLWRSPAFYGDEMLDIGRLFSEEEARLAILYAERARSITYMTRSRLYAMASDATTT